MSMTDEERATLVRLELEKAHDTFEEIEILRQAEKWNDTEVPDPIVSTRNPFFCAKTFSLRNKSDFFYLFHHYLKR